MIENAYTGPESELTARIIGAAIEVHQELGCGMKEEFYEAALCWELQQRGMRVERQAMCPVIYKGMILSTGDDHSKRIDLLVEDRIVVELKAVSHNDPVFVAQCLSYLRMKNLEVGLVLNFGFSTMKEGIRHVINGRASATPQDAPQSQTSPRSPLSNSVLRAKNG